MITTKMTKSEIADKAAQALDDLLMKLRDLQGMAQGLSEEAETVDVEAQEAYDEMRQIQVTLEHSDKDDQK